MFEVFGPFARTAPSPIPIVLALLPILGAVLALFDRAHGARTARTRAAIVCGVTALASFAAFATSVNWIQHLGLAARVSGLDLVLALGLDPLASLASLAASITAAVIVLGQTHPRRVALTCVTLSAIQFAVMADGAALLVLALAIASLVGGALGYVDSARFVSDRIADAALVAAAAIFFWTLGGSWVAHDYVPDLEPRLVVASREPNAPRAPTDDDDDDRPQKPAFHRGARASLSLGGMPNATVLVDGTWLRDARGGHIVASPFSDVPIGAGPHTIRVHVGAGSDDYYVPRVNAKENDRVLLAVRGATTTFREMQDDLVVRDDRGEPIGRDAIARRNFFGVPAAALVLALVALAFAARARVFPFPPAVDDPSRALVAIGAIVGLARFSGALTHGASVTCVLIVSSIVASARSIQLRDARALLGAELAFAAVGCVSASPSFGVMHAFVATILFASRSRPNDAAHVVLLPTRIGIVAAFATGRSIEFALLIVASWLAAIALARHRRSASLRAAIPTIALAVASIASYFFVPKLLSPSFRTSMPNTMPSLAVVGLVAAVVAFAWAASRNEASLDRLSRWRGFRWLGFPYTCIARAFAAVGLAIAVALAEVDVRLVALAALGDRAIAAIASLVSWIERAALERTTARIPVRIPVPSENAARFIVVGLALSTLALFTVPWLS